MRAEQVTGPVAYHGEGPVWFPGAGLRFVDMLAGDVLSLRADGTVERPRRGRGAVIGIERGFALEEPDGTVTELPELWAGSDRRMNEGGCDPDGRFYCGSMAYDRTPGAGALYRLDRDRSARVVLEHVTISNGLDWSPDGSCAYYNDTETYRVDVFDYDGDAGLANRRVFARVEPDDGRPDGLTVDAEGGVWVALNKGGAVRRYTSGGELDAVVEVPPRQVTACTFGGERLDHLYLTTSRENLPQGEDPLAGSLFRADVGVRGLPAREFAG
jgi:sugar lactone lactonase YvrE